MRVKSQQEMLNFIAYLTKSLGYAGDRYEYPERKAVEISVEKTEHETSMTARCRVYQTLEEQFKLATTDPKQVPYTTVALKVILGDNSPEVMELIREGLIQKALNVNLKTINSFGN